MFEKVYLTLTLVVYKDVKGMTNNVEVWVDMGFLKPICPNIQIKFSLFC